MDQVELRQLQLAELEILKAFDRVCEANGLHYFLSGGTCLGAVRHRGFIPWDDDIDVAMPYADYLRFLELGQVALGDAYFLQTTATDESFQLSYARVRKNHTTMIRSWEPDHGHHGIWMDIFPLIGVGGKLDFRIKRLLIPATNLLCFTDSDWAAEKSGFDGGSWRIKTALIDLIRRLLGKRRKQFAFWLRRKLFSQRNLPNLAEVWGSITVVVPASIYEGEAVYLPFEGEMFRVAPDYDQMLRCNYGNYMQLPPEDQRHGNHGELFVDLEHDWQTLLRLNLVQPNKRQQ